MKVTKTASQSPDAGRRQHTSILVIAAILSAGMVLSACKSNVEGTKDAYADEEPAGSLYNTGLAYMNAGKMKDAVKSFDEVDRQHPYTEWARKALLLSAYSSYKRGSYEDTVQSANRYLSLYPGSDDASYAQFLIAQSDYNRIADVTRDQRTTEKALAGMQEIVDRYPDSEYADEARQKVVRTRDQLAGKELQVGRYYLERREYIAAINRFNTVVEKYSDTRLAEEALYRLVEANLAMGLIAEANTAGTVLGHNYPNGEWYKLAYKRLGTGSGSPSAKSGSWFSRTFGSKNPS